MNQPVDPQLAAVRTPPHSIEAEQSVLGGLLLDNTAWDRISDLINEREFYRADHRLIFQHIARLIDHARGRIQVMPGGGIKPYQFEKVIAATGCREIHVAAWKAQRDDSTRHRPRYPAGWTAGRHQRSAPV